MTHSKYIIIGAGLSGLTTAFKLSQNGIDDVLILEGRTEVGGRMHTKKGVDLGATWFQEHHKYLFELLNAVHVNTFEQYSKGKSVLVYNTMAPPHYFESDTNGPSAYRIAGGSIALIESISSTFKDNIVLNTQVKRVSEKSDRLVIETNKTWYSCDKLIIAVPPKLVSSIIFDPILPEQLKKVMDGTHTWMSNAIKVGITFESPFWRDKALSGTIIGQIGPVIELYDHCCANDETYALMGFVNEGLRDMPADKRKERVLGYLETYFGEEIRHFKDYFEKDWSEDRMTSCENLKSVYMSPQYGNSVFEAFYMDGKLLFSGTETSPVYGGYLEGAVYSGLRAANTVIDK